MRANKLKFPTDRIFLLKWIEMTWFIWQQTFHLSNLLDIFSFHRFFQQVIEITDLSFWYIWSSLSSPFKDHPLFYRMSLLVYSLINILPFSQSLMLSLYLSFCKSLLAEVVGCIKSAPWLHPLLPRPPQKEATGEFWAMSHTAPYLEFLWASPLNCFKLLLQRPALTSLSKSRKYLINHVIVQF